MIHPMIHLNGTGKDTLIKEYRAGYDAVDHAMAKLRDITVHARDYYPQPDYPASFYQAQDEFHAMRSKLADVRTELEQRIIYLLEHK